MKPKLIISLAAAILFPLTGQTEEYEGIEFPQGAASFADRVVSYLPGYGGAANALFPNLSDPSEALGIPDYNGLQGEQLRGAVSLNTGGQITLEFVNNLLTGSGNSNADLHIFEVGAIVEEVDVEISKDGIVWHLVGRTSGGTSSIDIDASGFGISDQFRFIRITDVLAQGTSGVAGTAGAEINAVGAISSASVVHTPEITIETAVLVKFSSLQGSVYRIESSTDMVNWSVEIESIVGNGSEMKFCFEITNPKKFFRVIPDA